MGVGKVFVEGFMKYNIAIVLALIFGVVCVIYPKLLIRCFIKMDKKDGISELSLRNTQMLCRVGGVYTILIVMLNIFISYDVMMLMIGYVFIPVIGLYLLEKKLGPIKKPYVRPPELIIITVIFTIAVFKLDILITNLGTRMLLKIIILVIDIIIVVIASVGEGKKEQ